MSRHAPRLLRARWPKLALFSITCFRRRQARLYCLYRRSYTTRGRRLADAYFTVILKERFISRRHKLSIILFYAGADLRAAYHGHMGFDA